MRPYATAASLAYRPDIEGLRGVAVLSVFAVHSIPEAARGGFVGVDVFFVISGFLIATITLHELDTGAFTVAGFYRRRVRRLLPALLTVLAACLAFAAVWATPADARSIGKHVAAGATFTSNLVLWSEAGYFDPSSDLKPLLHLWSLGVEEQFYLLWPLWALLLARAGRWSIPATLLALCVSFALNVVFVSLKPKAVFFLPPTRFWEMTVGVVLALWNHRMPCGPVAVAQAWLPPSSPWRHRMPSLFASLGGGMLAGAVALIDKTDNFPGAWALLPTLGTFLLLAAGMRAWINRSVLSHPVLVFYGRISYPLYLWHWPLLTFPVLLNLRLDWMEQIAMLGVAVGLAMLTTHFVERPIRFGRLAPAAPRWLLGGLLVLGTLGGAVFLSDGLVSRYPARLQTIAIEQLRQDPAAIRLGTCFQTSAQARREFAADCVDSQPAGAPLALLWGDSFAAALYPGLRAMTASGTLSMRLAQFTGPLCPPLLQASDRQLSGCEEMNRVAIEQIRLLRPAMVVLAGAWTSYHGTGDGALQELDGLRDTIGLLRESGVARVVVLGSFPVWQTAQPRALLTTWRRTGELPLRVSEGLVARVLAVDQTIAAIARSNGAEFISPVDLLCNASGCESTVEIDGSLFPVAHDEAHLTQAGARRLAQLMLAQLTQEPGGRP